MQDNRIPEKLRIDGPAAGRALHAATLANGGASFWTETLKPAHPREGYAVGTGVGLEKFDLETFSVSQATQALAKLFTLLEGRPGHLISTWVEDGTVWVEASEFIADYDRAYRTAREAGELAIWSFAEQAQIMVEAA